MIRNREFVQVKIFALALRHVPDLMVNLLNIERYVMMGMLSENRHQRVSWQQDIFYYTVCHFGITTKTGSSWAVQRLRERKHLDISLRDPALPWR